MPDIVLPPDGTWTLCYTDGGSGSTPELELATSGGAVFRRAASAPDSAITSGHSLKTLETLGIPVAASDKIYARVRDGATAPGLVVVNG